MKLRTEIEDELLVIPGCVLETVGNRLFVDQNVLAFGPLQAAVEQNERRWLLRRLELHSTLPQGLTQPPLTSWAVIVPAGFAGGRSAAQLANAVSPRMNQRVIILVLGLGDAGEHWDGVIVEQNQQRELAGFQVIESQLPTARRSVAGESSLSPAELNGDFSRLAGATSVSCVRAIRETHVAVVGAGRNGSRTVQLLAAAGFGRIDVIDDDLVEAPNLDAMDCVAQDDIGYSKAGRVANFAHRLRPEQIVVGCVEKPVTSAEAITAIRRCSIVITAVDSDSPRLFVSLLASRYLLPHLDIACGVVRSGTGRRLAGDIRFLLPGDGCLHCAAGGLPDESRARHELLASPRALRRNANRAWHDEGDRLGSLGTLNSITCGIGVQILLDFLGGEEALNHSFWQRFEWHPGTGLQSTAGRVGAAASCEICGLFR
ncbi:MAG: ThiF family adenylyltransferase [Planctomycetaceae bacterium]